MNTLCQKYILLIFLIVEIFGEKTRLKEPSATIALTNVGNEKW